MSTATSASPPESPPVADHLDRNGIAEKSAPVAPPVETANPTPASAAAGEASAISSGERIVDSLALKVAVATSAVGKGLLRLLARTREEISDIWVEAQIVRRGEKK